MNQPQTARPPEPTAAHLVAHGLDLYGRGDDRRAVESWRRALELEPGNQDALDYLEAAGVTSEQHDAEIIDIASARRILTIPPPPASDSAEREGASPSSESRDSHPTPALQLLETLLAGKRYEEALDLLLSARAHTPDDAAISRGIRHIKDRLVLRYMRSLGDLDQVPQRRDVDAPLSEAESSVLALVDNAASLDDILHVSRLGRFETCRCLARLKELSAITLLRAGDVRGPAASGDGKQSSAAGPSLSAAEDIALQNYSAVCESLRSLSTLSGFLGVALVDSDTGGVLAKQGGGPYNFELAGVLNTQVVLTKRRAVEQLGLADTLEDIQIALEHEYHVIRPMAKRPRVFMYLMCDRAKGNLALARMKMTAVERLLDPLLG